MAMASTSVKSVYRVKQKKYKTRESNQNIKSGLKFTKLKNFITLHQDNQFTQSKK